MKRSDVQMPVCMLLQLLMKQQSHRRLVGLQLAKKPHEPTLSAVGSSALAMIPVSDRLHLAESFLLWS